MTTSSTSNFNQAISDNNVPRIAEFLKNNVIINVSLGGSECYLVYKTKTQDDHKTTTDTVVPYIADAAAIAFASQYISFDFSSLTNAMLSVQQNLALVGSVVAVDYISKMSIDRVPDEFKETYIDPI